MLLPYANDRRNTVFPAVTCSFIAANIIVYLCLYPFGPDFIADNFGFSPSHVSVMYVVTSMFVHVSPIHLLWNMFFLWLFGPNVEDALGHAGFAAIYLIGGFVAAMFHSIIAVNFMPAYVDWPVIGASGAIAGVLGIFAVRFYRTGIRVLSIFGPLTIPAKYGLGIWFLQQVLGGLFCVAATVLSPASPLSDWGHRIFSDGVAYWAHIGGMGFGMIMAFLLNMGRTGTKEYLLDDARASLEDGVTWHAAEHMRAVLERDPKDADVHANLARTYALQGDTDLAVAHYQKCVELFLKKKDYEKAASSFIELRAFDEGASIPLHSEFQIARRLDEDNRHEYAIELFKEIASSHPGTPEAEMSLVRAGTLCLHKAHDPSEAVVCYELFLDQYPHSSWCTLVTKSLAEARKRIKDSGEAGSE
jgi:membrane associated rhomboid family serine protease